MSYHPSQVLATSTDRDFERALLPFLQIMWPSMSQPNPMGHWDRLGIDLITEPTDDPIRCCIQCKGFAVQSLGPNQYRQILSSIAKFRKSKIRCHTYLIVHNRDARLREYERQVAEKLSELVKSGRAKHVHIYDRRAFLKFVDGFVTTRLRKRLRAISQRSLKLHERLYGKTWAWQTQVPIATQTLAFKRDMPAELTSLTSYVRRDIQTTLFSQTNTRWTMVTGHFGVGKSSATLISAHSTNRVVIRAECARFLPTYLGGGMNALTKEVTRSIGLQPPNDSCRKQFEYYAGRALGRILRTPKNDYVLVIDGLDENRHYTRLKGLFDLTNQLAEVKCPILLVTRRSHFDECFGDMSGAFFRFSEKNGPKRQAVVLDFGFWTNVEVKDFLEKSLVGQSDQSKKRIVELITLLNAGELETFYGSLHYHPLFLSFILDEVINSGISKANRCKLIEGWVTRKIFRDRNVDRIAMGSQSDGVKIVVKMFDLMEEVAFSMTGEANERIVLNESISEEKLNAIGQRIFSTNEDVILGILLNSVLVSGQHRTVEKGLPILFSHRVFQEYFLARALFNEMAEPSWQPVLGQ